MKFQMMAYAVTTFFAGAIAWIKFHNGKISAWLTVIRDITDFGDDLNKTCGDGQATPEEMQKLCADYNQLMADLGLAKKGVSK